MFWSTPKPSSKSDRVRLACEELETRANPVTIWNVDTVGDLPDLNPLDGVPADVNGKVSLRAAVQQANWNGGQFIINFVMPPPANADGEGGGSPGGLFVGTVQLTKEMDLFTAHIAVNGGSSANVTIVGAGQKGMFSIAASSTSSISNVTLRGGVSRVGGGGQSGFGGAINNLGTLTVSGVRIQDCGADYGGAIYNAGTMTINGSELLGNTAYGADNPANAGAPGGHGGAILCDAKIVTVNNSTIDGNTSEARGGGIAIRTTGQVVVTDTHITNNKATANGGGVYVSGGDFSMTRGDIVNNWAGGQGGGVFHSGGVSIFNNATIQANTAVGIGGGAFCANGTFRMTDCLIDQNSAKSGGGYYQQGGNGTMTRTTFSDNSATEWGGGAYIEAGTIRFTTCAFSGNTAAIGQAQGDKIAKKAAATITLDPDCTGIEAVEIVTQP